MKFIPKELKWEMRRNYSNTICNSYTSRLPSLLNGIVISDMNKSNCHLYCSWRNLTLMVGSLDAGSRKHGGKIDVRCLFEK